MKLFHYSNRQFDVLKSKRLTTATSEEIRESEKQRDRHGFIGAYVDHISFFFDPIPSKTLSDIFKYDHHTWFTGNVLYEHVIDVDQFEQDIGYSVVESRKKTAFMDEFIRKHNWIDDDPVLLKKYLKELNRLSKQWGEVGHGLSNLKLQIKKNIGTTERAYIEASRRPDFEEGKQRYATNVPHLMIYPKSGKASISEINRLTIGDDKRIPLVKRMPTSYYW